MKKDKIIFWTTTAIIALMMVFSGFSYFTNEQMKDAFVHLGFPDYFRLQLGTSKLLGAILLILPMVKGKIKEFTYFGFALTFISAIIAHFASGDPLSLAIMPSIFLVILSASYFYYNKLQAIKL